MQQIVMRVGNTPGGNKLIAEAFRRINKRALKRAEMANEFTQRNGRFKQMEFEREWADYAKGENLFEGMVLDAGAEQQQAQSANPMTDMSDEDLWNIVNVP
jgi:hypothetical protein